MGLRMEGESGFRLKYGNCGVSTWLQSQLSDLEKNTNSMLSLIKLEDGDSFAKRAEMYYQKRPLLERRTAKCQQLYSLLLYHNSSSISSISNISNSEDLNPETNEINIPKLKETNPRILEVELPNLAPESCEKMITSISTNHLENISFDTSLNFSEVFEESISKSNEKSPKTISGDISQHFEKWFSCLEEISEFVEDNKRDLDEWRRLCEENNEANKRLEEKVEGLTKKIDLLQNEKLKLLSPTTSRRTLKVIITDRFKVKHWSKFCMAKWRRKLEWYLNAY